MVECRLPLGLFLKKIGISSIKDQGSNAVGLNTFLLYLNLYVVVLLQSSRISFDYWKLTVNMLASDDRSLDTAAIHYMEPDCSRNC